VAWDRPVINPAPSPRLFGGIIPWSLSSAASGRPLAAALNLDKSLTDEQILEVTAYIMSLSQLSP
jgi:hypothetical protein